MYLYAGCNGILIAISPETGQEVWRTTLGGSIFSEQSGQDVCILEHDGKVFAGSFGHVYALDAQTGAILWRNELQGLGYNDVTLAMAGKSVQYVSSHSQSAG
ncbi:MAG TPA: PQQ-binding-like beta-propeller repeat protein [Thermoanaerobaculia bacterium]